MSCDVRLESYYLPKVHRSFGELPTPCPRKPHSASMEFQLERRFLLPVAPFPIINSSQFLMEDCKVLWDPSGWKVLLVTVTRHHLALEHLQSHSAWSFICCDLLVTWGTS